MTLKAYFLCKNFLFFYTFCVVAVGVVLYSD